MDTVGDLPPLSSCAPGAEQKVALDWKKFLISLPLLIPSHYWVL